MAACGQAFADHLRPGLAKTWRRCGLTPPFHDASPPESTPAAGIAVSPSHSLLYVRPRASPSNRSFSRDYFAKSMTHMNSAVQIFFIFKKLAETLKMRCKS